MKKGLSLALVVIMSLAVLLTGCGNSEQIESNSESSSTAQMEDTSSSEAESSFEPETSDPNIVLEEPEQAETPYTESNVPSSDEAEPEPAEPAPSQEAENTEGESSEEENSEMKMIVNVNGQDFTATLEQNSAVDALVQMMESGSVTLQLSDYAGFEKVGPLGQSLPTSNQQTTTQAGDIVLYQGNQIVMFYGSHSWSYTRLGHIDDLTGWEEALGSGDVTVTFSLEY